MENKSKLQQDRTDMLKAIQELKERQLEERINNSKKWSDK